MAISIRRYVDITSGVGGAAASPYRELIGRIVTSNNPLPPGTILTADTADDVAKVFGMTSPEYRVAVRYFAFISKQINKPKKLSFVRYSPFGNPPKVVSDDSTKSRDTLMAFTDGRMTITVKKSGDTPVSYDIAGIDFSTLPTVGWEAAAATVLQTRIRTAVASEQLATATVTIEILASGGPRFTITGGAVAAATMDVAQAATSDVSVALGLSTPGAQNLPGVLGQSPTEAIASSAAVDNNFGSFSFIDNLQNNEIVDVAAWNAAQNVEYMYCVATTEANARILAPLLVGFSGTALTLTNGDVGDARDWSENCPMEILAATDYQRPAASQNYMYYQFGTRPQTVDDNPTANVMDKLRVNYIGRTQVNGKPTSFYQRGVLMGDITAPTDMTTYANEIWLKSTILADIMNAFLALPAIPANEAGRTTLMSVIQAPINQALTNGVVSVGKPLTMVQKAYITQVTGDPDAWQQVEVRGFWFDANLFSQVGPSGTTEWKAKYVLVYSKSDQIRKVEGSDILI